MSNYELSWIIGAMGAIWFTLILIVSKLTDILNELRSKR